MNFLQRSSSCSCSCSFFRSNHTQQSNLRSQSFSHHSFNSSFSSRSSIAAVNQPSTTVHHRCIFTFRPNSDQILSLAVAGSHQLLTGSSDAQIHIFPRNPTAGEPISIPCNSAVKSLQILNENVLISAHQDHKIRIWKMNELKLITTLPTLKDRLTKLLFAKNYVKIRRHKKLTWVHHVDAVSSLAISIDKSLIYSGSWDRSFKVWRTSDFKCLESVSNAHDDAINAVVLSDDGFVYTGSSDKKIKVWKRTKHDQKHKHGLVDTLEQHRSGINALAYDSDGSVLYSGAGSGALMVWERRSGGHMVVCGALLGHKKAILCVGVVGELVCSGSADTTVRVWRRVGRRYSCLSVLEGHGGPVKCVAMAESCEEEEEEDGRGHLVYSGGLDCDIKVWKVWVPFGLEMEHFHANDS